MILIGKNKDGEKKYVPSFFVIEKIVNDNFPSSDAKLVQKLYIFVVVVVKIEKDQFFLLFFSFFFPHTNNFSSSL